eukprot:scaffold27339_cov28-Tisochrysis_lutea.AAC.2
MAVQRESSPAMTRVGRPPACRAELVKTCWRGCAAWRDVRHAATATPRLPPSLFRPLEALARRLRRIGHAAKGRSSPLNSALIHGSRLRSRSCAGSARLHPTACVP